MPSPNTAAAYAAPIGSDQCLWYTTNVTIVSTYILMPFYNYGRYAIAYSVMAYLVIVIVMVYIVMAYVVITCIVMA